jgi:murein DD-endopeptidase MepM/ murein hydrolase activator NlpD
VQIILVSNHMATARSITLTRRHLVTAIAVFVLMLLTLSSMFSYLTVRHAAEIRLPFLQDMLRSISLEEAGRTRDLVRENLANMASRLGQMQGQLMQLDSLGERLAGMAGVKLKDVRPTPAQHEGRGGPLLRPDSITPGALQQALDELARQVEARSAALTTLESRILDERIRQNMLPTSVPVIDGVRSSGFGWRADPFTGLSALHEGLDFNAEPGTPIHAAAAGIVQNVERHPEYGNVVDIDHGDELITRYAHASLVLVKEGQIVKRGQQIAAVGSTGRSTGSHLHFEVRIKGVPQNPARFLDRNETSRQLAKR